MGQSENHVSARQCGMRSATKPTPPRSGIEIHSKDTDVMAREPSELKTAQIADAKIHRGPGGETHQVADGDTPILTTQQGIPISDDQNSLKIGARGPTTLEDFVLREKIFHFDHERIPERIVHARGTAAHGYFELTQSLAKYTTANSPPL